jgi:hypothetical protein
MVPSESERFMTVLSLELMEEPRRRTLDCESMESTVNGVEWAKSSLRFELVLSLAAEAALLLPPIASSITWQESLVLRLLPSLVEPNVPTRAVGVWLLDIDLEVVFSRGLNHHAWVVRSVLLACVATAGLAFAFPAPTLPKTNSALAHYLR